MEKSESNSDQAAGCGCFPLFAAASMALIVFISLLGGIPFVLFKDGHNRAAPRPHHTQNHMKQIGLSCHMYANANDGWYPPLTRHDGFWMIDLDVLKDRYLPNPQIMIDVDGQGADDRIAEIEEAWESGNTRRVTVIAARNFFYFGYVVRNSSDVDVLVTHRGELRSVRDGLKRGLQPLRRLKDVDMIALGNASLTNIAGSIPVICEIKGDEVGAQVGFLDGHVEVVEYGEFPLTDRFCEAFGIGPDPARRQDRS